jgi:arginyl-tRNA--protein-N-Asp/Glu arginylyltransferase
MKIYFKHYSGAIAEYDYMFFDCMAKVSFSEEDSALQQGWLPDDYFLPKNEYRSHWYQARQTRINLKKFQETKSTKKTRKKCSQIQIKKYECEEIDLNILNNIFLKYFEYKQFKPWKLEPLVELEKDRKFFLVYHAPSESGGWHNPVAFTYMRDVGSNSVFSTQFAWDYSNPKLYLGKYANLAEIDYCIKNNKDYMYTGMGYENCCIYKSSYKGFEFWTGEEWSDDIDHYKFLCERDSRIINTKELDKIKKHDDQNFFKK